MGEQIAQNNSTIHLQRVISFSHLYCLILGPEFGLNIVEVWPNCWAEPSEEMTERFLFSQTMF